MGIVGVVDPVADGFIGSILQCFAAACCRHYGCAKQFHSGNVGCLTFNVLFAHVHNALYAFERTHGSGSHTMLPGAGFGNNALFAQPVCQQYLPDGIVDFMRAGMAKVFALQPDIGTILFAQPFCKKQGGWPAYIIA